MLPFVRYQQRGGMTPPLPHPKSLVKLLPRPAPGGDSTTSESHCQIRSYPPTGSQQGDILSSVPHLVKLLAAQSRCPAQRLAGSMHLAVLSAHIRTPASPDVALEQPQLHLLSPLKSPRQRDGVSVL